MENNDYKQTPVVKEEEPKLLFPNYGWICPVCGKGLSPYVRECDCWTPKIISSTTLSNSTTPMPEIK